MWSCEDNIRGNMYNGKIPNELCSTRLNKDKNSLNYSVKVGEERKN